MSTEIRRTARAVLAAALLAPAPLAAPAAVPPYFTNVTTEVGLDGVPAFRIAVGDLDGDGYPDIFIHTEPDAASGDVLDKQFLYLNEPGDVPGDPYSRKFVDHTAGSGIRANRQGTTDGRHSDAAIFADVDNDGDLDVFTNVYLHRSYTLDLGTNDLLINDGTAHFVLSPNSTFHTQPNWNTPTEVFMDYDNDSRVDLFIGTWYNPDDVLNVDRLYHGGGDGSFEDVTATSGIGGITTCVYAVGAFDWNGDGFVDLVAPPYSRTVIGSLPRHWRNDGDGSFTRVEADTNYDVYRGFTPPFTVSFGTIPRDYDNDGDVDFLEVITHGDQSIGVWSAPVRNDGGVFAWRFGDVIGRDAEDPDMSHHGDHFASWTDVDADGLADYLLTESGYGNPRLYLFLQNADHTFSAATVDSGLNDVNLDGVEPGYVTPVDFDLDGDEDLLVTTNAGLRLYRNDVGTQNHWIAITLEGVGAPGYSNRGAIGARVEVTTGAVTRTQEVYAGNGHEGPMRPLTLYFGLGPDAAVIDRIRVRWPNTTLTTQELTAVDADRFLAIREPCAEVATDPSHLRVERDAADLVLTWDDPAHPGWAFNVYRDPGPDPSAWGPPLATGVTDGDPSTPGIQWRDPGAATDPTSWHYLVTAVSVCGESPLR